LARGEWVAFLDDDDIWLPDKLEVQLAAARETGADLVTCNFIQFNETGEIVPPGLAPRPYGLSFAEALMLENYVSGGSAAPVSTGAMRQLEGFDEQVEGVEDWDMWRRLSWDHHIYFVNQVLVKYRRHDRNQGSDVALALRANAIHFGKMLSDTPPRLHHMVSAAKRRFFNYLVRTFVAERLIEETIDPAAWRALNAEREAFEAERRKLVAEIEVLKAGYDALVRSTSWRITAPLRKLSRMAIRLL
jgi:glycosyltransferase involved in cell wall biosynthesis